MYDVYCQCLVPHMKPSPCFYVTPKTFISYSQRKNNQRHTVFYVVL